MSDATECLSLSLSLINQYKVVSQSHSILDCYLNAHQSLISLLFNYLFAYFLLSPPSSPHQDASFLEWSCLSFWLSAVFLTPGVEPGIW